MTPHSPSPSVLGVEFSDAEQALFASAFRQEEFAARDTVKSPSRPGNLVFYVARGLVRFYYLNEDATESDRLFAQGGSFVRPVTAVPLGLAYGCQALAPSVVLTASYEHLSAVFANNLNFRKWDEAISRSMLTLKDRHVRSLQDLSAVERVQDFAARFPELVDTVPQYHIANYLGMSPISYSRLKNKAVRP